MNKFNIVKDLFFIGLLLLASVSFGSTSIIVYLIAYILVPLITLYFIVFNKKSFFLKNDKIILSFFVIITFSIFFNITAIHNVIPLIKFIFYVQLSFLLYQNYNDLNRFYSLLYKYFISIILISLFFIGFIPTIGRHQDIYYYGDWRGFFGHKNALGYIMIFATLIFIFNLFRENRYKIFNFLLLITSLTILYSTNSKSSMVLLIVIFLAIILIVFVKKGFEINKNLAVAFSCFLLIILIFSMLIMINNINFILIDLLGRDLSLSGRLTIYNLTIEFLSKNFLFGYGFMQFWSNENNVIFFENIIGFPITSSHSGFLDLFLDLGIVGLIVFILHLSVSIWLVIKYFNPLKASDLFAVVIVISIFLFNFLDSRLFNTSGIFFIMYFTISIFLRSNKKFS